MPSAAVGFCPTKGCPNRSRGPCVEHATQRRKDVDLRRGSRHERGYGSAWDKISARWKAKHPCCGERADGKLYGEQSACVRAGLRNPGAPTNRTATDHIVTRDNGGTDEESNLQTLCQRCHSVKTTTIDAGGWSKGFS